MQRRIKMERWNITRTLYKISDFLSWQRNGLLELSPSFQRRPVWLPSAKSFLMDTIVKGLPIPIIFIREQTDLKTLEPKRQIVDGQQRIRTVLTYIVPKSLKDYKESRDFFQVSKIHNPELGGKNFDELPRELRQQILNYQFSVHILPSDVDDKQVLQIFARMNATGLKLKAQELRNANYSGDFKQTMYNLAYEQLARWREWGIFTENNIARMDEVEMTSDFVLLMYKGISTKSKRSLDNLYRDRDCEDCFPEKSVVEDRFRSVMDSIYDTLGADLRHMEFKKRTLFYSLFALIYDFRWSLQSRLEKSSKKPLPENFPRKIRDVNELFVDKRIPGKVAQSATRRTTNINSRKEIFNFLKERCGGG